MVVQNTDFGRVADDLRRAAASFALMTSQATLLGRSLQAFREFERQLVLTNAIAQGSAEQYRELTDTSRQFALVSRTSAIEAGEALQNLAQAGFNAQESMSGLAGVLLLSQATLSSIGQSADVLTSNIRAFKLETSDMVRVSNVFTAAITGSLATMDKLTFAMRQAAPVAEVAGLSIEETTAMLGQLFNVGLRGEQAGTTLRNLIVRLIRPTGEAAEILREFGVATVDATGNFRGLEAVLKDLAKANLGEAQLSRIFEQEALAGALALMESVTEATDGTGSAYQRLLKDITGTDRALIIALKNLATFDGQLQLLKNSTTDLAIGIGETLAPYVVELAQWLRDMAQAFREMDDEQRQQIARWIGYGAAITAGLAALNAVLLLFGQLGRSAIALTAGIATLTTSMWSLSAASAASSQAMLPLVGALGPSVWARWLPLVARGGVTLAALAAAAYGAYKAFQYFTSNTGDMLEELQKKAKIDVTIDYNVVNGPFTEDQLFAKGVSIAQQVNDFVGTDIALKEAEARIKLAKQLIDGELINLIAKGDVRQAISAAGSAQDLLLEFLPTPDRTLTQQIRQIAKQQGASIDEVEQQLLVYRDGLQRLEALEKQTGVKSKAGDIISGAIENLTLGAVDFESLSDQVNTAEQDLKDLQDALGGERSGILAKLAEDVGELSDKEREVLETLVAARKADYSARLRLLDQLDQTGTGIGGVYEEFANFFRDALDSDYEASEKLVATLGDALEKNKDILTLPEIQQFKEIMANGGLLEVLAALASLTGASEEELVRFIVEETAGRDDLNINYELLAEILTANQRERATKVIGTVTSAVEKINKEIIEEATKAADFTLRNTDSLTEALEASRKLFSADLVEEVSKFSASIEEDVNSALGQVGVDLEFDESLQKVIDNLDKISFEKLPNAADLFSFDGLSEQLSRELEGAATIEEANAIAEVVISQYVQLLEEALKLVDAQAGNELPEAVAASFRGLISNGLSLIGDLRERAVREAVGDFDTAKDRIARDNKRTLKIPDEVKQLREYQDAMIQAADATREASRRLVDAYAGFGVNVRADFARKLDIADIVADFNEQVLELDRAIEDLKYRGDLNVSQKEALRAQYAQTIDIIERAKQAEIDATNSFTAQMERRSAAIEQYTRDLRDAAAAGKISDVSAGFLIGLTEFSKDLITVVDIWEQATTDALDSVSGTLGDVIYEGKDLLEGLRETALDISRKVFENFTNAFLQDVASKLAESLGGTGSIIEEALGGLGQHTGSVQQAIMSLNTSITAGSGTVQSTLSTSAAQIQLGGNAVVASLHSIAAQIAEASIAEAGGLTFGKPQQGTGTLVPTPQLSFGNLTSAMADTKKAVADGVIEASKALGVAPNLLGAVINKESGFNPTIRGGAGGNYGGLIQFGPSERQQFGVDLTNVQTAIDSQLGADGAIVKFFKTRGFQPTPGDNLTTTLDLYSTVLAGSPGRYSAGDINNGGNVSSIYEEVTQNFGPHLQAADQYLQQYSSGLQSAIPTVNDFTQSLSGFGGTELIQGGLGNDSLNTGTAQLQTSLTQVSTVLQQGALQIQQAFAQISTQTGVSGTQVATSLQSTATGVQQQGGATGGGGLVGALGNLFKGITGMFGNLFSGIFGGFGGPRFAGGGDVYGPGTTTSDSIMALLSNKEFVVKAKAAEEYRPLLRAINEGAKPEEIVKTLMKQAKLPAFADGGSVGMQESFAYLGSKISPLPHNPNAGSVETHNYNLSPTYNIVNNGGDKKSADRFRLSAAQHAKDLGRHIERSKRNT